MRIETGAGSCESSAWLLTPSESVANSRRSHLLNLQFAIVSGFDCKLQNRNCKLQNGPVLKRVMWRSLPGASSVCRVLPAHDAALRVPEELLERQTHAPIEHAVSSQVSRRVVSFMPHKRHHVVLI